MCRCLSFLAALCVLIFICPCVIIFSMHHLLYLSHGLGALIVNIPHALLIFMPCVSYVPSPMVRFADAKSFFLSYCY